MNLEKFKMALLAPRYVSAKSAWVQHIPFAFTAVDWLRPRTIVELGTYMGDSYFAFCQAVDELKIDACCSAVDSWSGDRHAGKYAPTVLADLRRYHDPRYARFSRLLPAQFDEAAAVTPDGSVDLLHIDGLHTYDAVRHDVEMWLPKLSSRGVILLHDTQVKRDHFGVFSLWNEVYGRFPSFEFTHGYGLGILAVGNAVPPEFLNFLAWAQHHAELARSFFEALGIRIELARGVSQVDAALHTQRAAFTEALDLGPLPVNGKPHGHTPALFNGGIADLKQWLDHQLESLQQHTEWVRLFEGRPAIRAAGLAISAAPDGARSKGKAPVAAAPAALSLYWPNEAGQFDSRHLQTGYLPADGNLYTARFCLDLPAASLGESNRRVRLDPGDRPGIWRIQGLDIRLLDGAGNARLRLPPSILQSTRGVVMLNASRDLDHGECHDFILFCGGSDPQTELSLGPLLPAGAVTVEIVVHCRVWNSVGAFITSASAQGAGVAGALGEFLRSAMTK